MIREDGEDNNTDTYGPSWIGWQKVKMKPMGDDNDNVVVVAELRQLSNGGGLAMAAVVQWWW